jgi:hypothetical protein
MAGPLARQAGRVDKEYRMSKIICATLVMMLCGAFSAVALENMGAAKISLNGGSRGIVPFPHHDHQNRLQDCQKCHTLFPQEQDSIDKMKEEGKLVKKQVMNELCINCHKATKKTGSKSGPTTCSKCHVKKK